MTGPLSTGAEEYLSWLAVEKGRARNTLVAYRRDIAAWERWAGESGVDPLHVGIDAIELHLAALRSQGRNPASMARSTAALRGLYRFLASEGVIDGDPTADVRSPRLPRRLPKALDEDQALGLLDSVDGTGPTELRDRALLELLYGTGARISEAVGLSLIDLQGEDGLLRVFGKGSKERLVPLGGPARAALDRWLSLSGRPLLAPIRWKRRSDAEAVFINTRGAASAGRARGPSSTSAPNGPASASWSAPMCSATPAPVTCWPTAPTSGWSRSCWATSPSPPPRSTRS